MSVFIEKITIKNLLSFDEEGITDFELKPLNVLIGANASGKSNFALAIRILMATSFDLRREIELLGGMDEVRWKGVHAGNSFFDAMMSMGSGQFARYRISLGPINNQLLIGEEDLVIVKDRRLLKDVDWQVSFGRKNKGVLYRLQYPLGNSMLNASEDINMFADEVSKEILVPIIKDEEVSGVSTSNFYDRTRSILQIAFHDSVRLLREKMSTYWKDGYFPPFGSTTLATPNEAGVPQDRLNRDASNLASYVSQLTYLEIFDGKILPLIQEIYPNIKGIKTHNSKGKVWLMLQEKGLNQAVLQPKISEGILRITALLGLLFQPDPPALICIEEPENGFHPDVLRVIAKALKEASQRTQIIVTTHSPDLLGYMEPEDVVVCERGEKGGTQLRRLESERLKGWLKRYDLGELWLSGELGGTRY